MRANLPALTGLTWLVGDRAQLQRKREARISLLLPLWLAAPHTCAWAGEPVALPEHSPFIVYLLGSLLAGLSVFTAILWRRNQQHLRIELDVQRQHAEITHAARLALIGEITASITHEVTQPLSAILNNVETAELLLRRPEPDLAMLHEILVDIRNDEIRAYDIVKRLRVLLQKRELRVEDVDVNGLTRSVLALLRADAARRQVEVHATLDPGVPRVLADPVHLQQVLLNLIINGMDAMEETPVHERRIDIKTVRRQRHIEVVVSDNGKGIEPSNFTHLFKPFFTTKRGGMGVGLSISRSIIALHGGSIQAENCPSGGAMFRFTIPIETASSSRSPVFEEFLERPQ